MRTQLSASLLIIFSGICYGLMGYFGTKLIQIDMSILCMLFWRFFVAAILLVPLNIKQITRKYFPLKTLLLYVLSYCGGSFFYFIATLYIGTGISMVIFFSFPIFVLLFSYYFDSKAFSMTTLLTLIAIMFGLMLLKGQGEDSIDMIGIVFALLASVSYAVYVFSNRKKDSVNLDARLQSFLLCLGSAGVFLPMSLYQQQFTFPVTFQAWIYILGISIIATALPIQLMLVGMKQTSAVRASILTVFEPLVTFLVGIVLLNEMVSTRQIFGVIVVLTSVTLYQLKGALKFNSIETRAKKPSCNNFQEI